MQTTGDTYGVIRLSDVEPLTPEARRSCEAAFRRGYMHGYANALRDVDMVDGSEDDIEDLYDFLDTVIAQWRWKRESPYSFCLPPKFSEAGIKFVKSLLADSDKPAV